MLTVEAASRELTLRKIYTLGYEGATLPDFISTLQECGISLLLDIRELPQSRRPGFSKRVLSEALADAGICYRHIKQLGDPKPGRDAARRGDMEQFRTIFCTHMELEASCRAVAEVAADVERETVALMCFERAPKDCHRSIVAQRIQGLIPAEVIHIGVPPVKRLGDADGVRPERLVGTRR
ncbi:DUF488 family protein [Hansschlegelia sp. KR7-227]|uniref:DUF488 domain-containing protein n=1 Tax=Hansschlegelia sp. KR7-227 TaxID=3400914 RepID=UPI003C07CFDA